MKHPWPNLAPELTPEQAWERMWKMRTERLGRFIAVDAPRYLVVKDCVMVVQAYLGTRSAWRLAFWMLAEWWRQTWFGIREDARHWGRRIRGQTDDGEEK